MLSTAVRIHLDPHKNVKVWCLLLAHPLGWTAAAVAHSGLAPIALTVPPPGVPGDTAAAESHLAPLHVPARTELALPGKQRCCRRAGV